MNFNYWYRNTNNKPKAKPNILIIIKQTKVQSPVKKQPVKLCYICNLPILLKAKDHNNRQLMNSLKYFHAGLIRHKSIAYQWEFNQFAVSLLLVGLFYHWDFWEREFFVFIMEIVIMVTTSYYLWIQDHSSYSYYPIHSRESEITDFQNNYKMYSLPYWYLHSLDL